MERTFGDQLDIIRFRILVLIQNSPGAGLHFVIMQFDWIRLICLLVKTTAQSIVWNLIWCDEYSLDGLYVFIVQIENTNYKMVAGLFSGKMKMNKTLFLRNYNHQTIWIMIMMGYNVAPYKADIYVANLDEITKCPLNIQNKV